jgi:hypothetical protein
MLPLLLMAAVYWVWDQPGYIDAKKQENERP